MVDQPSQFAVNSATRCATARAALRREKIAARQALPAAAHAAASASIHAHLVALLSSRAPGVIAFCWPIRAEVDCRPLVAELCAAGWRAAMPTVVAPATPMEFRAWEPAAPLALDPHGIPVPAAPTCLVPDVLLLPLVAFDVAGFRLGYGGGYFDRTLAVCIPRPLTVGIGFELARTADMHPQAHDIPLDIIVTETGARHFPARATR